MGWRAVVYAVEAAALAIEVYVLILRCWSLTTDPSPRYFRLMGQNVETEELANHIKQEGHLSQEGMEWHWLRGGGIVGEDQARGSSTQWALPLLPSGRLLAGVHLREGTR